ncbi:uncharacterized protein BJ171DRAFT_562474 [Polychytrium aggregatum]|uniref:uncharacterized protein n=1 Tax=Polychytrium aggregatum TaxID=110093 RepID=UPI0022FE69B5|nr:uncharacterized protein BJ171DRAFT_562474 [Polychytrium aggregatum]KAI9202342.1 hypothetical protein BJ171DRAFT_562474 [Polychytrium aggregatum]
MASHKTILVTGAAGFIGSHLAIHLTTHFPHYNIIAFDKMDYCSSLRLLEPLLERPNFCFVKGDITSPDFVSYILVDKKVDIIMHLAAQSHVDNSFGDSFEFTKNNIMGTHVLLEASRKYGKIERFIHVSTDEVYGAIDRSEPDSRENSILEPSNPYSATKAAAECLVKAYFKSFHTPVIVTRSNNVYGPSQYPEKVIPKFICALMKGRKLPIHGNGSNSRHYLYVTDTVQALTTILELGQIGETYNIGSEFEISNLRLAKYLIRQCGIASDEAEAEKWLEFVEDRAFNDMRYAIDSAKLKSLGWSPQVTFEDGIQRTIDWYRHNLDTWWDEDISAALVAHPLRKLPNA